jgi:hypothetical protein
MATMNRQIVLAARPEGLPKPSDFVWVTLRGLTNGSS